MIFPRWVLLSAAAVVTLTVLIAMCSLLGGSVALFGLAVYLLGIVLPGMIACLALTARFRHRLEGLASFVFFSNLIGTAMLVGSAWLLSRSGEYSLFGVAMVEAVLILGACIFAHRELWAGLRDPHFRLLDLDWDDLGFLVLLAGAVFLLVLPLSLLYSHGFLIGGDSSTLSAAGAWDSQAGRWLLPAQVGYPFAPPGGLAPGVPVLFGVYASASGLPPVYFAGPMDFAFVFFAGLGAYLLAGRFTERRWLAAGVALAWTSGGVAGTTLFFNNLLDATAANSFPDNLASLMALFAVLFLLADLLRTQKSGWFETSLLSAAILVVMLDSQETLVFVALIFLLFGLQILWRRGWRWTLPRLALSLLPSVILIPTYLIPGNQSASSPLLASGGADLRSALGNWGTGVFVGSLGPLGVVAILIGIAALGWAAWLWLGARREVKYSSAPAGILALSVVAGVAIFFSVNGIGPEFFGLGAIRLYEYAGVAGLGLFAYGMDRLCEIRLPRVGPKPITGVVIAVLLVSGGLGTIGNLESASAASSQQFLSTLQMQEAGEWLSSHAAPKAVLVADQNAGNTAILTVGDFVGQHQFVVRDRIGLYTAIYGERAPYNWSEYYANLVLTDPTPANAASAYERLGMEYWVLQRGFDALQIQTFSLLPYFSLVYSNAALVVFQYVGGETAAGFLPAIDYSSLGQGLTPTFTLAAYSSTYDLPQVPNSISSISASPVNGQNITYEFPLVSAGKYFFYVHRLAYRTDEYLSVWVGNGWAGSVYFAAGGPELGTPLPLSLSGGTVTINLEVEGDVGWVDPIDYLVLVPSA